MRTIVVLFAMTLGLLAMACGRPDSNAVTLRRGEVQRIDACHIILDFAPVSPSGLPFADMRYVCGAAESQLKETQWWGDKPQPLAFSISKGDCIPLDTAYYCVENVEPGSSVTLKATYQKPRRQEHMLKRLP